MQQLGLKNKAIITARKISLNEVIKKAPLCDPETNWLVPKAQKIFTEWYHLFKNPQLGKMDAFSVAKFISNTTKDTCLPSDNRVDQVLDKYSEGQEKLVDLQGFLRFYFDAAVQPGASRQACYSNLKKMNVREDLVKLSEVADQALFDKKQEMPRYALQANQEQY